MFDDYLFLPLSKQIFKNNYPTNDINYESVSIIKFGESYEVVSYNGNSYKRNGYYDGTIYYIEQPWVKVDKVKKVVIEFE